jgi:hypothetical protein
MIHSFGQLQGLDISHYDTVYEDLRSDIEKQFGILSIHNPESNDLKTVRSLADEVINTSGALVKIFARTENADYDAVWDEDADPSYWMPIDIKGYFKPNAIEAELERWGVDVKNKIEITFSHRELYNLLGERMLRAGDVVQVPYNTIPLGLKNFRVINATPAGNFRYHWLYFMCQCELLTADITVRPEQDMPSDEPIPSTGLYRESL